MITTYEDYLALPMCLAFEEMVALHREIVEEAGQDAQALALYKDLLALAVKYSESRPAGRCGTGRKRSRRIPPAHPATTMLPTASTYLQGI